MKAYIICFCTTLLITFLAEKALKKNGKIIGILLLILAIFVLCFFAGIRDLNIGKDVSSYFMVAYNSYVNDGNGILDTSNIAIIEIGFAVLMYLASLFKSTNVALFIVELLVCIPIFLFAYKKRENTSITFIIFIFLTTLYCKSLNLIRQSIAISIIILSTYYFEEKKYKNTVFLMLLAYLFHETAIISLIIYLIIYICQNKTKNKKLYLYLLIFGTIFIVFSFEFILKMFPNKYSNYFGSEYEISSFSIMSIIKKMIWIVIGLFYILKFKKDKTYNNNFSYIIFFIIDFIFYFMSIKISPAGRLGYYFLYTGYFTFIPNIKNMFKQKNIINILIIILMIAFWYNMTVINYSADAIYPYTSDILPILND